MILIIFGHVIYRVYDRSYDHFKSWIFDLQTIWLGSNHVGVGLFWQVFRGVLVQKLVDLGVRQSVPDFGITDNQHLSRGLFCVTRVPLMLKSHLKIYDIHYRWTQLFKVLYFLLCFWNLWLNFSLENQLRTSVNPINFNFNMEIERRTW